MKYIICISLLLGLLTSGCVNSHYKKTVTVEKDSDGKIVKTLITEEVFQPNQMAHQVPFEYLKDVQPQ
jgi:hypothetical protein